MRRHLRNEHPHAVSDARFNKLESRMGFETHVTGGALEQWAHSLTAMRNFGSVLSQKFVGAVAELVGI